MASNLRHLQTTRNDGMCRSTPALPNGAALDADAGWWRSLWYVGCALCDLKETAASRVRFSGEEVEYGDVFGVVGAWNDLLDDEQRWQEWKENADKCLPRPFADLLTRDNIKLFARYFEGRDIEGTDE